MANKFRTGTGHSAEYFGDTRDHWWNLDYLQLIAKRLAFDEMEEALDVGCGVGHWSQTLASVLPCTARVHGVDADPDWVKKAAERAASLGLAERFSYRVGLAERLPFTDASFDLVTCQTVLIHMADPGAALDEMIRVTRPGGLLLAAEPNNLANALVLDSVSFRWPVEKIMALARFQLVCERGKAAIGEGNNSIGDLVPGMFAERGLMDIRVYLNDKTSASLPPYDTPEQRAMREEHADFGAREFWIWSRRDARRFFVAGGGVDHEFDALWALATGGREAIENAYAEATYSCASGAMGYLVAGRKPASLPDNNPRRSNVDVSNAGESSGPPPHSRT